MVNGQSPEDDEFDIEENPYRDPRLMAHMDDTILLVGLLLFQASLFKSGYAPAIMNELQDRVSYLIRHYTRKGF